MQALLPALASSAASSSGGTGNAYQQLPPQYMNQVGAPQQQQGGGMSGTDLLKLFSQLGQQPSANAPAASVQPVVPPTGQSTSPGGPSMGGIQALMQLFGGGGGSGG